MGAHHAPHSSPHAPRLAGRGALTAAAALALAGGTASLAFADEAPSVPTRHEIQGSLTSGAHDLQHAAASSPLSGVSHASAHSTSRSLASHGADLRHQASDAAAPLEDRAPSSLPTSLPISDMAGDGGHALSSTGNDISHAATNWSAAAEDGLSAKETSQQAALMSQDVTHALENGKQDASHLTSAATEGGPELPSMLSFS